MDPSVDLCHQAVLTQEVTKYMLCSDLTLVGKTVDGRYTTTAPMLDRSPEGNTDSVLTWTLYV